MKGQVRDISIGVSNISIDVSDISDDVSDISDDVSNISDDVSDISVAVSDISISVSDIRPQEKEANEGSRGKRYFRGGRGLAGRRQRDIFGLKSKFFRVLPTYFLKK